MSLLSPKLAAQVLGVSESSLKRWVDQGVVAAVKTAGGHRRLEAATLVEYARRSGRQIVMPELPGLGLHGGDALSQDDSVAAIQDALLRGDERGSQFLARACLTSGISMAEFGDRFISSAFRGIGEHWSHGTTEIYEERRACNICQGVFQDLSTLFSSPATTAPIAIGAAAEGDPYTLATSLVSMVLHQNGWRAQSLGSNLPWFTLAKAVRDLKPRLFWLSVSTIADHDSFVRNYREFFDTVGTQTAVVIGGRAWTGELRDRIRFGTHCDHLRHLEVFAATLAGPVRKERSPDVQNTTAKDAVSSSFWESYLPGKTCPNPPSTPIT